MRRRAREAEKKTKNDFAIKTDLSDNSGRRTRLVRALYACMYSPGVVSDLKHNTFINYTQRTIYIYIAEDCADMIYGFYTYNDVYNLCSCDAQSHNKR